MLCMGIALPATKTKPIDRPTHRNDRISSKCIGRMKNKFCIAINKKQRYTLKQKAATAAAAATVTKISQIKVDLPALLEHVLDCFVLLCLLIFSFYSRDREKEIFSFCVRFRFGRIAYELKSLKFEFMITISVFLHSCSLSSSFFVRLMLYVARSMMHVSLFPTFSLAITPFPLANLCICLFVRFFIHIQLSIFLSLLTVSLWLIVVLQNNVKLFSF